jgi:hypothetical protein
VLTEDDRAFLRGVIAQFDAFAAIKGHDLDSRGVRAWGRFRVGTMRLRLGQLQEVEQEYGQALRLQKQLAADFPNQPELHNDVEGNCVNLASLHLQQGNCEVRP